MSRNGHAYDRRIVLKTIGGSVLFAGTAGLAAGDDYVCAGPKFGEGDVVQTAGDDGTAIGADRCPEPTHVFEVENGHCGRVVELCCSERGWWYLIEFEDYEERVWIYEEDLRSCFTPG